jgi:ribonuclease P protein component
VAFAIGRAIGPAVSRNLLRRRLRSLLGQCSDPQLALAPGWYLFGVRPGGALPSYDELAFDLERLLRALRG